MGAAISDTTGGSNLGDNANWSFSAGSSITWTGATSANWNLSSNWDVGRVPGLPDAVTIPAPVANSPILTSGVTIASLSVIGSTTLTTSGHNLSVSGNLTVPGTLDASGAGNVTVGGATVSFAGGTYTSGTGTFTLDGGAAQTLTTNANNLGAVATATAATNVTLADNASFSSLAIAGSTTVTTNGHSLSVSGNVTGAGALKAAVSESISVGGNWSIIGFTSATSTVTFTGTGAIQAATTFYNITVAGTAVTTLQANIVIDNTLTLNGMLNAGAFSITMNGNLWNNVGGTFNGGTGTVTFLNASLLAINGNNSWYNFTCLIPGKTIQFQHLMTQTILPGGNFNVQGSSSNLITLTSDIASSSPNLPLPPALQGQWVITDQSSTNQTVDYVIVLWSYATVLITPGGGAQDGGNNFGWNFSLPIVASWTLDTNNNGRIDRIRVQVLPTAQLNNDFSGLTVQVSGYVVTGYQKVGGPPTTPTNTDVFDILLQEGTHEDTNATPSWQITSNTTLKNSLGGAQVQANSGTVTRIYVAASGARPVITYTLAALNGNTAYVHFSEPVYGNSAATAPIASPSLSYTVAGSLAVQPIETSGNAAHAAIVTLPSVLGVTDILQPGGQKITAATLASVGQVWSSAYPNQFDYPSAGSPAVTHNPGDPGAYTYTNIDGNLPPSVIASPPYSGRSMLTPSTTTTAPAHNISDVGIGLVTPVIAEDQSTTIDPTKGGFGSVTVFDGSKSLPPHNVFLEARIVPPTLSAAGLTLWWDITPPSAYDFNDFWIPSGATTLWNIDPSGDRVHYTGDPQARSVSPSPGTTPLRDFIIAASDAAIKEGALFQFMFLLDDGTHKMPVAFAADPNNPANVRPFEYVFHSLVQQRGGVTITNNVIRPENGQIASVHYTVTTPGPVTITVFDLSGSIVNVLQRGSQSSGEYSTTWDGKNRGGRIVARGIYFIRVVGPGFDEIRKVLVVR